MNEPRTTQSSLSHYSAKMHRRGMLAGLRVAGLNGTVAVGGRNLSSAHKQIRTHGSTYEGEGVLAAAAAELVVVGPASAVASALPDVTVAQSGSP